MKGLVLAGGTGTRLWPITKSVNKHLLPIYDKPLIYYPLATLMLSKINEIAIISTPKFLEDFRNHFEFAENLGIEMKYISQLKPEGLPQGLVLAEEFIGRDHVTMILGDNIFHGVGLGRALTQDQTSDGAKIFCYEVANPSTFGVAKFENGKITQLIEKPNEFVSNKAITGLYVFDNNASTYAKSLNFSKRGEYEIVDLLEIYRKQENLNFEILPRGTAWLDTGTIDSLLDAGNYIKVIEQRQGTRIACLEEISWRNSWISDEQLEKLANTNPNQEIKKYLLNILSAE